MEALRKHEEDRIIRVIVADDSATARLMICRMLESDPGIRVVGMAVNGREAVEQVNLLEPDLVTMDVNMPVMDGIMAIEKIMAYHPVPVLVVSSIAQTEFTANAARALGAGAVDVIRKPEPSSTEEYQAAATDFKAKVKLLSRVQVITHPRAQLLDRMHEIQNGAASKPLVKQDHKIIAIGSSTGGPQALQVILGNLPADLGAGVVIVQHIAKGFTDGLVDWLDNNCRIKVCKGSDGQKIEKGNAYVAPDGIHMTVVSGGIIKLVERQIPGPHKPSIDVLLESVAEAFGAGAVGVILTGMGRDGALGIKTLHDRGGQTIAQDKESSVIFSMAKEAIRLGGVDNVLPLPKISEAIIGKV